MPTSLSSRRLDAIEAAITQSHDEQRELLSKATTEERRYFFRESELCGGFDASSDPAVAKRAAGITFQQLYHSVFFDFVGLDDLRFHCKLPDDELAVVAELKLGAIRLEYEPTRREWGDSLWSAYHDRRVKWAIGLLDQLAREILQKKLHARTHRKGQTDVGANTKSD